MDRGYTNVGCLYIFFLLSKNEMHRNLIFKTEESGNDYLHRKRNIYLVKGSKQRVA